MFPRLCLLCLAIAQEDAGPRFVLHGKSGPFPPAALQSLGADWSVTLAAPVGAVAGADWVALQQAGRHRPPPPSQRVIVLGNGDRLAIKADTVVRLTDGRLRFTPAAPLQPSAGTELSLYPPYVALVLLAVPEGVDDAEKLVARLQREERANDVVLLRNGDRIAGSVSALDAASGCTIEADGRTVRAGWSRLAGVAFATTGLARPRPRKLHALAVLADGMRVRFASLRYEAGPRRWAGRTTTGTDVTIAEGGLAALDLLEGRAVYLSTLRPIRYEPTPYLGVRWPLGVNVAADGRPLRVGADTFDLGLAMHSRSEVTYRLDGKYAWFEATAGLDPTAGRRGRARLAVIVDGKEYPLEEATERTGPAALAVRLDVRKARELTLVVDFGSLGDVQARVHWGGARLIRER